MNEIVEGFKLSPQQRRLWRTAEDPSARRTECLVRITGPIDTAALDAAVHQTLSRHEILRTRFQSHAEVRVPFQIVDAPPKAVRVRTVDAAGTLVHDRDAVIEREMSRVRHTPLTDAPPLPFLIRWDVADHTLGWSLPAACLDFESIRLLVRELADACGAATRGGTSAAGEPLQYADFAAWRSGMTEDEAGRTHWESQAAPSGIEVRLPFERRAAGGGAAFLDGTVDAARVRDAAAAAGVTMDAWLLAGWLGTLWRWTESPVLRVGLALDGRKLDELTDAVGLFEETVPLISDIDESMSISELARTVARHIETSREWEEYSGLDGDPWTFGFACSAGGDTVSAGPASFRIDRIRSVSEPLSLGLRAVIGSGPVLLQLQFDDRRIDAVDAACVLESLECLLDRAPAHAADPLSCIDMLSSSARARLLAASRGSREDFGPVEPIHEVVAAQARRVPDRLAVVSTATRYTYRQLDERANQVAHWLRRHRAGAQDNVVIWMRRGSDVVVALLGVLKAGAAYVPVEGDVPEERLRFVIGDTGARVLISDAATMRDRRTSLPDGVNVLCIDGDAEKLDAEPASAEDVRTAGDAAAYVLFTSGSTGKPKGVIVEHRQVWNYANGVVRRLGLEDGLQFAMVSTFGADLGNTVLFGSLWTGGTLHILSADESADPQAAERYFAAHPVDCMKIVPSHLKALLDGEHPERIVPRRLLVFGGEALDWPLADRVRSLSRDCRVFNHYGPTETTVGVMSAPAEPASWETRSVPVGWPLPNVRADVLDRAGHSVPNGVPGELVIGGANVARGYLNRPELTAERFTADAVEPGGRVYRTGDVVRRLPDGRIEFIGRRDDQVKIRGYRVELGEVEAALRSHDDVREAVVIARDDEQGNRSLAAYVVPRVAAPAVATLKGHVRSTLPEHMVPASIVFLKSIPLNPNGKVDRQALPAPEASATGTEFTAPRTPTEQVVGAVWCELLRTDRVSVHDNFFDVGGNSLIATNVVARVRHTYRIELPLKALFEHPTIAGFCGAMMDDGRRELVEKTSELLLQLEDMTEDEVDGMLEAGQPTGSGEHAS